MVEFAYPCRPWRRFKCDGEFLSPGYFAKFGRHHRGIDLNLDTGGDTDLGYPVQSMFPGTVVYAERDVGSWGGLVLVRADDWVRRLVEERLERPVKALETLYAHLHQVTVSVGDVVNAGECVGSIGKGTYGQYWAHLHLEQRLESFAAFAPQGSGPEALAEAERCADPQLVMELFGFSDQGNTLPQRRLYAPTRVLGLEYSGQSGVYLQAVDDKLYLRGS